MSNPISLLYDKILEAVAADTDVASLIKENNLIDFNDVRKPTKAGVTTADLPELVIYVSSVRGNLHASSSHVMLTTVWSFILSTGTFKMDVQNTLLFAILKVLTDWKNSIRPVEFASKQFVKDVRLADANTGVSNAEANRNIRGWAAVIQAEIDLGLDLSDLTS